MAQSNYNATNIDSFIISFLLDCILNTEENTKYNKEFEKLINELDKRNIKGLLLKYYINLSTNERALYRKIKPALIGDDNNKSIININPLTKKEKKKNSIEKKSNIKNKILQTIKEL